MTVFLYVACMCVGLRMLSKQWLQATFTGIPRLAPSFPHALFLQVQCLDIRMLNKQRVLARFNENFRSGPPLLGAEFFSCS